MSRPSGARYELLAKDYLLAQGLHLLQQNYASRFGEIDLVMLDQDVLCFVEVKFRNSLAYGGAIAAITPQKQQRLVKTALFFITEHRQHAQRAMRFDALIIQQFSHNQSPAFDWLKNAFYAE